MTPAHPTLVIVATYNEIENLPRLVASIFEHLPDCDVLVVDDASPDGTGAWCEAETAREPRLKCLHRTGKLGLGTAIVAGLQYAIQTGYEFAITIDADFSHPPELLPKLVAKARGDEGPAVDVAIGSRYVAGGRIEGWPLRRHAMSRGVNFISRYWLGLTPRDCSGNYRCYRTRLLAELDLTKLRSLGYSLVEELLWRLQQKNATFAEIPYTFVDRRTGSSKINVQEIGRALWVLGGLKFERDPAGRST